MPVNVSTIRFADIRHFFVWIDRRCGPAPS